MKKIRFTDLLELEDQLPIETVDVYHEGLGHDGPISNFDYNFIKRPNTHVLAFPLSRYASWTEAEARLAPLFKHRKIQPYHQFKTARHWCFYCTAEPAAGETNGGI